MAWITAVTDRTAADITNKTAKAYFTIDVLTRIYNNQNEVAAQLLSLFGATVTLANPGSIVNTTFGGSTTINLMANNIELLRIAASLPDALGVVAVKNDYVAGFTGTTPTYVDINAWENNLNLMHIYIPLAAEYKVYCGVSSAGQSHLWQSRFRG